uniref:sperm-associated antigen 5 n=1 Tax=Jaculus jaculus TaxID=51337 RepID=UPI001E1B3983|nr:sperm-associated antigen 5 [Jaculus jaculus]
MWRVKTLNLGLTPSPQPGKATMRTPLRELTLQAGALTDSGKGPPACSSLTPSLSKLGLQEGRNNSSPVSSFNVKKTNLPSEQLTHPSRSLGTCQHESAEQLLDPAPQTNLNLRTPEKAAGPESYAADPAGDCVVKTTVLMPLPVAQQQGGMLEALSDTVAQKEGSSANEPLRTEEPVRNEVAPCIDDSFLEVAAMPEKLTFLESPSFLLEYSPKLYCEQQSHCSKESPKDSRIETIPEDLVPSDNNVLQSSILWLSPSTTLSVDFPVNLVDPGEEAVEHRMTQAAEMNFPTLSEEAELGDQALISNLEDVLPICPTSNPAEMESQADQGPTLEDTSRILATDSEPWMSPLAWLEKGVNTSAMLENLRQSLSLPSVLQDAAIGNTPLSTCSVGTWFTPPAPQEESTNKLQTEGAKDSLLETERLLWGHRPPDLTALSRHDLEDNLLSSLVILQVLFLQLQAWKSQLTVPHAEAKDSSTQTDSSLLGVTKKPQYLQESQETRQALQQAKNIMQSWVLVSKELMPLLHLSLLHLEEDRVTVSRESQRAETLVSCCSDVVKKLRTKLQSLKTEREEARHREEMALQGKDGAEAVLEVFCAHASQRISQLEQDLTSMREFRSLLQEAQTRLIGLHTEQEELAQQTVSLTSTLHQDWTSMQADYGTWTALLSRSRQLTEKLTAKSQQALWERDAAVAEKQQISKELEQVFAHLEDCKGQIEQLKLENSRLTTDLQTQLQILASTDSQLKELQSQHAHCAQDLATKDELLCQLTQSNEEQAAQWQKEEMALKHRVAELQHQQAVLAKEVQDLKETLEFADQESQVAHLELGQIECQLNTTLHVLRERSLQCENLKDTVENLKAELASTTAKHQEQTLEKTQQYSQELWLLIEQIQSLTHFLQTKVKEKAESETVPSSTACTSAQEHPLPDDSTMSGNISAATADEEPESAPVPLLGSDTSAFTRVTSMVSLQPTETPSLEKSLAEMSTMLVDLQSLCGLLHESKEEAIGALQRKLCDLQARLEAQEEHYQEAQKTKEADIEKLNQALCLRYKNEKELQEVVQKQSEKILEQIDKSGELISLREEVTQLTHLLRRAETETKVLQEALEGQLDPNCQLMATNWIQEKVSLCQEVDKLRVMFLEMKNEKAKLVVKYQSHRNILEENLRRSDTELKKLDDTVQHIYETLLSIPEVVRSCKELQGLLEFLS